MAGAVTAVRTYSRFGLLELQVRALLRGAAGAAQNSLTLVSKGLKAPHYIETVIVQGLYARGTIGAELRLNIDWREHAVSVRAGGSELQMPTNWGNGIAPSLDEAVHTFNEAVAFAGLRPEWSVCYGSQWNVDQINQLLGFRRAELRRWEREPDRLQLGFGPLSEASLVVSLAV